MDLLRDVAVDKYLSHDAILCSFVCLREDGCLELPAAVETACQISFSPCEGSASLQAEGKVWGFDHELGLTEEGVPLLSEQGDAGEGCIPIIRGLFGEEGKWQADYL